MSEPILLHPAFNPAYYAFYLEGLQRLFPGRPIVLSREGMPSSTAYDDGCALFVPGASTPRIYLSANDHDRIDLPALQWCDRYGMVNWNPAAAAIRLTDEQDRALLTRVQPIGPSFGIRPETAALHTTRLLAEGAWSRIPDVRTAISSARSIKRMWTGRQRESAYHPGRSDPTYIFFVAWAWQKHAEVNPPRARFMRACKRIPGIQFEGGFAPRRRRELPDLEDVTARRHYPIAEYLRCIRRSAVVFNNPAVHGCHGWKLGEFLALGKAILSLPLSRQMPAPLVHGIHVHYVDDDEAAIEAGLAQILGDPEYRSSLERNARRYYEEFLAPHVVMRRLTEASRTPARSREGDR